MKRSGRLYQKNRHKFYEQDARSPTSLFAPDMDYFKSILSFTKEIVEECDKQVDAFNHAETRKEEIQNSKNATEKMFAMRDYFLLFCYYIPNPTKSDERQLKEFVKFSQELKRDVEEYLSLKYAYDQFIFNLLNIYANFDEIGAHETIRLLELNKHLVECLEKFKNTCRNRNTYDDVLNKIRELISSLRRALNEVEEDENTRDFVKSGIRFIRESMKQINNLKIDFDQDLFNQLFISVYEAWKNISIALT